MLLSPPQWVCIPTQVQGLISDCPLCPLYPAQRSFLLFIDGSLFLFVCLFLVVVARGMRVWGEPGMTSSKVCPYELLFICMLDSFILPWRPFISAGRGWKETEYRTKTICLHQVIRMYVYRLSKRQVAPDHVHLNRQPLFHMELLNFLLFFWIWRRYHLKTRFPFCPSSLFQKREGLEKTRDPRIWGYTFIIIKTHTHTHTQLTRLWSKRLSPQQSSNSREYTFCIKRIPQSLEGIRMVLQSHRGKQHKRLRILY